MLLPTIKKCQLITKCKQLGIGFPEKARVKDCVRALQDFYIKNHVVNDSLRWILKTFDDPQLCSRFKDFSDLEKDVILHSADNVAQPNFDGVRIFFCGDEKEDGFFARQLDDDLMPWSMSVLSNLYKRDKKNSFVLDCELSCSNADGQKLCKYLRKYGLIADTKQQAIADLLHWNLDKIQWVLQLNNITLDIWVLDVLRYGDMNCTQKTLAERLSMVKMICREMGMQSDCVKVCDINDFTLKASADKKINYLRYLSCHGFDGVIFKNVWASYNTKGKRTIDCVKLKVDTVAEDIYLAKYFVPIKTKAVSVDPEGKVLLCRDISMGMQIVARLNIPEVAEDGGLKPSFFGKEYTINGDYYDSKGELVNPYIIVEQ